MQVVYARCAGLDVHKKTVSVCVSLCEAGEAKWQNLKECGVTHVAMEATSVYWRPVWAMLEGQFEQMLANPAA
jgi:transposase